MKERRISGRFGLVSLAEITSLTDKITTNAFVANASETGLGLYMEKYIDSGRDVRIKLTYFDQGDKGNEDKRVMEQIDGKVLWIKVLGSYFYAGIAFNVLDQKKHKQFMHYLKNRKKD
ncbi:MAG TPA: PilZ domain-containing protein [Nitrospiria bacterium]|nr:PilZ domain-containing protein [Nitrospiria bacterium]